MATIAQPCLPHMTQNTEHAPDTVLEPYKPLRPRSDTFQESEVLLSTFHNPVIWTAIGILSASWTEYTRQRIPAGDRRQWQTEWISWAVLFAVAQVTLFLRSPQVHEAAGEEARSDSNSLTLGRLNVLAVAVANAVAHSLWLYFRLDWALVSPRWPMLIQILRCVPLAFSHGHDLLCCLPIYEKRVLHTAVRPRVFYRKPNKQVLSASKFPTIFDCRHCCSHPVNYPFVRTSGY
jgi:hypothetical protein